MNYTHMKIVGKVLTGEWGFEGGKDSDIDLFGLYAV
jgi:hypothetical protein